MELGTINILTGVNSEGQAVVIETGSNLAALNKLAKQLKGKYSGMMITPVALSQEN